jgi:hypothetical protein
MRIKELHDERTGVLIAMNDDSGQHDSIGNVMRRSGLLCGGGIVPPPPRRSDFVV